MRPMGRLPMPEQLFDYWGFSLSDAYEHSAGDKVLGMFVDLFRTRRGWFKKRIEKMASFLYYFRFYNAQV